MSYEYRESSGTRYRRNDSGIIEFLLMDQDWVRSMRNDEEWFNASLTDQTPRDEHGQPLAAPTPAGPDGNPLTGSSLFLLQRDAAQRELLEVEAQRDALLEALRAVEWRGHSLDPDHNAWSTCPACGGLEDLDALVHSQEESRIRNGHAPDCKLHLALAKAEKRAK